jgi:hypothetical protein
MHSWAKWQGFVVADPLNRLKVHACRFQETANFTKAKMTGSSAFGAARVSSIMTTKDKGSTAF